MSVQTTIKAPPTVSVAASARRIAKDLDYLAARLHACRSRMAEGERLDELCRIRSLTEFIRAIFPEYELNEVLDFQRLLVYEMIRELSGLSAYLSGSGADLVEWMVLRFQVENLKVLLRAYLTKTPIGFLYRHLAPLPAELTLDNRGLAEAQSLEDFVRQVPKGLFRKNLEKTLTTYHDHRGLFFFETALDQGYFQGLVARTENLSRKDRESVSSLVYQEVDIFHLMLVARGKYHYNLTLEMLRPFHVAGTRITPALFSAMLNDQDLYTSAGRVALRVLDGALLEQGQSDGSTTVDASALEDRAWKRFLRLANLVFRRSHMGLGTIIGYVGLRRIEVANLITISEGINSGMATETISGHLVTGSNMVGTHV